MQWVPTLGQTKVVAKLEKAKISQVRSRTREKWYLSSLVIWLEGDERVNLLVVPVGVVAVMADIAHMVVAAAPVGVCFLRRNQQLPSMLTTRATHL